jgi:hypothetical protein
MHAPVQPWRMCVWTRELRAEISPPLPIPLSLFASHSLGSTLIRLMCHGTRRGSLSKNKNIFFVPRFGPDMFQLIRAVRSMTMLEYDTEPYNGIPGLAYNTDTNRNAGNRIE